MKTLALALGTCIGLGLGCASRPVTSPALAPLQPAEPPAEQDAAITCPNGATIKQQENGATQMCVLDGSVHGVFARFGADGEPLERAHYDRGVLDGSYEVWDPGGVLRVEGQFERGERSSRWRWYAPEGTLQVESNGDPFVEFYPGGEPRFVHDARGDRAFAADGSEVPVGDYIAALASEPVVLHSVDASLAIMLVLSPAERIQQYTASDASARGISSIEQECALGQRVRVEGWPSVDDVEFRVTVRHRHPLPPMFGIELRPSAEALHASVGTVRFSMLGALSNLPGLVYVSGPACGHML